MTGLSICYLQTKNNAAVQTGIDTDIDAFRRSGPRAEASSGGGSGQGRIKVSPSG